MKCRSQELPAPLLDETLVLAGGARIALALWREGAGALRYRLCFTRAGACLVRYDNEQGRAHRRLRGRTLPYEFRSIEQLRYDFERAVEAAQAGDGAHP
ncbi:MAG TPA: DUF6516 family protein [Burkholderiales bacterium]|nr:DUF6516 family protein [Burkholderiales bacterium]